jgi:hypothetical protein
MGITPEGEDEVAGRYRSLAGESPMFDLSIRQRGAGKDGRGQTYVFASPFQELVSVTVLVSTGPNYSNTEPQEILISFRGDAWLYRFLSNQDPTQDPSLIFSADGQLSIEGAGTLTPLTHKGPGGGAQGQGARATPKVPKSPSGSGKRPPGR